MLKLVPWLDPFLVLDLAPLFAHKLVPWLAPFLVLNLAFDVPK